MIRKIITGLTVIVILIALTGCPGFEIPEDNAGIIDLPSSIASDDSSRGIDAKAARTPEEDAISALFSPIRDYVGFANDLGQQLEELIVGLPTIEELTAYAESSAGTYSESGNNYVSVSSVSVDDYDLRVNLSSTADDTGLILQLFLDSSVENKEKGMAIYITDMDGDNGGDTTDEQIKIIYDVTASTAEPAMELMVGGAVGGHSDSWHPDALWLMVWKSGTSLKVTGISSHPNAWENTDDMFLDTPDTPRYYMFSGIAYTDSNVAAVQVAIPEQGVTADFYTTYSPGQLLKDYQLNEINNDTDDNWAQYADWLDQNSYYPTAGGTPPATSAAFTEEDMMYTLEGYQAYLDDSGADGPDDLAAFIFIADLINPVYFDEEGYRSHGTTVPTGYPSIDEAPSETIIPDSIDALSIDFE